MGFWGAVGNAVGNTLKDMEKNRIEMQGKSNKELEGIVKYRRGGMMKASAAAAELSKRGYSKDDVDFLIRYYG